MHYQNILKWRMMAQDLGEEIFVTAFKAAQDLRRGQECRNFDWPIVIGHNNVQLKISREKEWQKIIFICGDRHRIFIFLGFG